ADARSVVVVDPDRRVHGDRPGDVTAVAHRHHQAVAVNAVGDRDRLALGVDCARWRNESDPLVAAYHFGGVGQAVATRRQAELFVGGQVEYERWLRGARGRA